MLGERIGDERKTKYGKRKWSVFDLSSPKKCYKMHVPDDNSSAGLSSRHSVSCRITIHAQLASHKGSFLTSNGQHIQNRLAHEAYPENSSCDACTITCTDMLWLRSRLPLSAVSTSSFACNTRDEKEDASLFLFEGCSLSSQSRCM